MLDPDYESHVSPLSPPLSGGSLRGQAFSTCFGRAPQYYPGDLHRWLVTRLWCCYKTQNNGGRGGGNLRDGGIRRGVTALKSRRERRGGGGGR